LSRRDGSDTVEIELVVSLSDTAAAAALVDWHREMGESVFKLGKSEKEEYTYGCFGVINVNGVFTAGHCLVGMVVVLYRIIIVEAVVVADAVLT
jgi:hypothetical protein